MSDQYNLSIRGGGSGLGDHGFEVVEIMPVVGNVGARAAGETKTTLIIAITTISDFCEIFLKLKVTPLVFCQTVKDDQGRFRRFRQNVCVGEREYTALYFAISFKREFNGFSNQIIANLFLIFDNRQT